MATPNYEQIQSFGNVTEQLKQSAIAEFAEYLYDGIPKEEVIEVAVGIATKYSMLGAELGAQWYDLCSELAGLDVDPAELSYADSDELESRASAYADSLSESKPITTAFNEFLQNEINNSIRMTGNANLWRDYERGTAGGKWARVPVGDTCAWCLMLASQGAWYLSEKSALGSSPDHYHDGCNCIAVYHADAESISGYSKLTEYKHMYYDCENIRMANDSPTNDYEYPEDLKERIERARANHSNLENIKAQKALERGEDYEKKQWTVYNEDLIIMRYKYGVK